MVFSKRERRIAIIALTSVVLLAFYYYALDPYLQYRAEVESKLRLTTDRLKNNQRLVDAHRTLIQSGKSVGAGALKSTASDAESQALNALRDWIQESGLTLAGITPDRTAGGKKDRFVTVNFHANATGSTPALFRLLLRLQTTPLPVRATSLLVTSRKEGADDLAVQLGIATLCLNPDFQKPEAPAALKAGEGATP